MRDYQIEGLNWLISFYEKGINGIIGDEKGLGKKIQTIAFLAYLKEVVKLPTPYLILNEGTWESEFKKWCPSLSVLVASNPNKIKEAKVDVIITWTCVVDHLVDYIQWGFIVLHGLKVFNVRASSKGRLAIIDAALPNQLPIILGLLGNLQPKLFSPEEIYDIIDFCQSDKLPASQKSEMVDKLHKVLKPFLLRRLKSQVFPQKTETKLFIGLSKKQREMYKKIILEYLSEKHLHKPIKRLKNTILQLQRLINHPYLIEDSTDPTSYSNEDHFINNSGKLVLLDKLLSSLQSNVNSRVFLFSLMKEMLSILEDYLIYKNYSYYRLDTNISSSNEDFNNQSDKFVFLSNTNNHDLRIQLNKEDVIILFDSSWNPNIDFFLIQNIALESTVIYRFILEGTIEEIFVKMAETKNRIDPFIQESFNKSSQEILNQTEMNSAIEYRSKEILADHDFAIIYPDLDTILSDSYEKSEIMKEETEHMCNSVLERIKKPIDSLSYEGNASNETTRKYISCLYLLPLRAGMQTVGDYNFAPKRLHELLGKETTAAFNPEAKLTEEEEKEKQELICLHSFCDWKRKDFRSFIKANALFGRNDLPNIIKYMKENTNKEEKEVEEYFDHFWKNYKQLQNWEQVISKIEKGEEKLKERELLNEFMKRGLGITKSYDVSLSPGECELLLETTHEVGFGNWDELQAKINNSPHFRFNWYLRTLPANKLKLLVPKLLQRWKKQ